MRVMTQEEFDEIYEKHQKWLGKEQGGEQAIFENVSLEDINLSDLRLMKVRFSKVLFKKPISDADLRVATFKNCIFQNVVFGHCDISIALFKGCFFQNCRFSYTNLGSANFENANLNGSKFYTCCLDNSYFDDHSDTCKIAFHNCNITGIDMPEPVYCIGPIGSRYRFTTFFAGRNIVQCGCWNGEKGGTLEEFKARIDKIYPSCSEGEDLMFREQYLAAIEFFERMRKLCLIKEKK